MTYFLRLSQSPITQLHYWSVMLHYSHSKWQAQYCLRKKCWGPKKVPELIIPRASVPVASSVCFKRCG